MNQYLTNNWKLFRDSIIELDGSKCSVCGRKREEVTLQVHHKRYINGLKPWEYSTEDCITLCRGCHASEHGIIKPKVGWEYIGDEDLGDLIGTCENCNSPLRYIFYIFHPDWGTIGVGTHCCDLLTDSNIASNMIESQRRFEERKERFTQSKRWKNHNNNFTLRQGCFDIDISYIQTKFFIEIQGQKSSKPYESLEIAKAKVFDVIESGKLMEYFKKNNIEIIDKRKNKQRKD